MITDVSLVFGCLLLIFSITGAVAAFADRRLPIRSIVMFFCGGVMVVFAGLFSPDDLTATDVPEAIVRIIAYILR